MFVSCQYPAPLQRLLLRDAFMELGPGIPNVNLRESLLELSPQDLFEAPLHDLAAARCCLSALWLFHDFLDESHKISQEVDTIEGSYWHAIMHRREMDYWNSKYWFRRVGKHPVFAKLQEGTKDFYRLAGTEPPSVWDPFEFVDVCEMVNHHPQRYEDLRACLRKAQQMEWELLFDYCNRKAKG